MFDEWAKLVATLLACRARWHALCLHAMGVEVTNRGQPHCQFSGTCQPACIYVSQLVPPSSVQPLPSCCPPLPTGGKRGMGGAVALAA